ncbi:MAG: transcriptional repressor [Candidatus Paceibacterota bacterium]
MERRSTKHKQAILEIFENNHLLSAKELQQQISDADASTIYRNLTRLEEDDMLRSVPVGEVTKYELIEKHDAHDHFICKNCEMVKTIFVDAAAFRSQLPTDENFSVTVHGTCNECR